MKKPTMTTQAHPQIRTDLRDLFLLRPDVVFLNHGSFGACPRPVFEAYQTWQRELERQPVEFLGRRFDTLMRTAREALGAYLNADRDDLVYVPNATTGLNVVAHSLPLQPGDEVVSTDQEYGALDRTWRFVCGKRGASYVNKSIPLPVQSKDEVVEAVWAGVSPRTRVLFLSHVTSPTAITLPITELIDRARAASILTVVDGAHVPGQIPLDLTELGADFYAGNCHKWLCAPKGAGFLYARREMQGLLEPLIVSWGWNRDTCFAPAGSRGPAEERRVPPGSAEQGGPSRFIKEQQWQGTHDPAAYLSVPAAIQFQAEHDWPWVRAECHELLREARRRIEELTGLPAICPDSPEWYTQMAAFPLPPCDGPAFQRRLYEEYHVEVPVMDWNGRHYLRVSVQGYNTPEDVEALIAALRALLPGCQRP